MQLRICSGRTWTRSDGLFLQGKSPGDEVETGAKVYGHGTWELFHTVWLLK